MRKIIVLSFMTLDGIMQAPGGPQEDTSGSFTHGGWSVPYWDKDLEETMGRQMGQPFDLLLGRRTYDIFAAAWPAMDPDNPINSARKYVVTHHPVPPGTDVWKNSVRIAADVVGSIRALKDESGPDIQVHGSASVVQLLLQNNLADELWLKIYPLALGYGKRLFGPGTVPAAFSLKECRASSSGVILANYQYAGQVQTGSF